jgi:phosphoglycolate phosphatase
MARQFELIVFDWDGTLMDSTGVIAAALQLSAVDLGLPPVSEFMAKHVIGLGLKDTLSLTMPGLPSDRYPEVAARYRHHFLANSQSLKLFNGIRELIDALQGRQHLLAVATGKARSGLNQAMSDCALTEYFHASRCADECFSKPHPQMLEELMDELGVMPETTLMIGDTSHDLQMARNAGVRAVAVSYGAHEHDSLKAESPLACCDSVEALTKWLHENA